MILVLLGTQNNNFERLLNMIEKCIDEGIITEQVIVQSGHENHKVDKMEMIGIVPMEQLQELISKANLIITHRRSRFNYKFIEI